MNEIVVISGKGGTGKTSLTAAFSLLSKKRCVVADCDVDAADMHILVGPDYAHEEDFYSGVYAELNTRKCTKCGNCFEACKFDAVIKNNGIYEIEKLSCEGCGYCAEVCPSMAIKMIENNVGKWYKSQTRFGNTLVHAALKIGAENSGKLVAKVKQEAKETAENTGKDLVIVDGSPGIGCPVVSSLSGADFVVFVTEPSLSGIHDLKRVHQLVKKFKIRSGCIINKYDLNRNNYEKIKEYMFKNNIIELGELPYDEAFTKSQLNKKTILEYNSEEMKKKVKRIWKKIDSAIN